MTELLNTFCRGRNIQLLWQPELETIPDRIAEGFVPIEMAEGTKSFVDFRCLDHHNDYSHLRHSSFMEPSGRTLRFA